MTILYFMLYRVESIIGFSQDLLEIENRFGQVFRGKATWVRGKRAFISQVILGEYSGRTELDT